MADGSTILFLALAATISGVVLSPLAEWLIAHYMPRLGSLPPLTVRGTTAAATGALFALLAWRFSLTPELPAFLFLALLAVQLSRIDFTLHLLPNPLIVLMMAPGTVLLVAASAINSTWPGLLRAAAGAAILSAIYFILALVSPRGLGMGDVKLAAPLGMYLGYLGWNHLLYGGLLGFVVGGVLTILMLRLRPGNKPKETAHGPAMLSAALGVILFMP